MGVKYCDKCGLPLGFKRLESGKWCPTNPDGSDHWDLCRQTWLENMSAAERAAYAERDRIAGLPIRTVGKKVKHVYYGTVPPWDESLGSFRDFTADEIAAGVVCRKVHGKGRAILL